MNSHDPGFIDREKLNGMRALERPGNEGFLSKIIGVFLNDAERRLQQIRDGIDQQDAQAVVMAAHTLKGSCSYVGASRLADLCREMEQLAGQGDLNLDLAEKIDEELAAASIVLNQEIGNG